MQKIAEGMNHDESHPGEMFGFANASGGPVTMDAGPDAGPVPDMDVGCFNRWRTMWIGLKIGCPQV
jgi:hypothetical protein